MRNRSASTGRCGRIDGGRGASRARQREVAGGDQGRHRSAGQGARGRDPEDCSSVHLSGGTPGWVGRHTVHVRPDPPPGAAHPRGAPSAEEAAPCLSRLRPPPPAMPLPQAGPRCLPARAPTRPHPRTAPPGASRGSRPTPYATPRPAGRTGTRLRQRTDPGRRPGWSIRNDPLAARPTRAAPPFARAAPGPLHSSRPSGATLCPSQRVRTNSQPGRPTRGSPPTRSQADKARCRHPQGRAGPCPHSRARHSARRPSRLQERPRRPEPLRSRHPCGPSNCPPRTPP